MEGEALLERWRQETDIFAQHALLKELFESGTLPGEDHPTWESEGGLYPDLNDNNFLPKLMQKREFQESKQISVKDALAEDKDKCRISEDFELSPVQRFVSRLLSPRTPYMSALFYHGVGVGKTCAAVTVCESYLELNPGRKAYIVAPPNIQEGFRRTLFDKDSLKVANGSENATHRGCTADLYISLTGSYKEKSNKIIESRVASAIKSRYEFFGYTSFYNHIRKLISSLPKSRDSETAKRDILRREFSNRVLIIDEAHNLRDNPLESADDEKDDVSVFDSTDAKAGKRLTPFLKEVLEVAEGVTLVLMTATPMYNSYTEIIFLLNLLLINDKYPTIRVDDVFDTRREKFTAGGRKLLGKIASHYISFMRGENPITFPLRIEPIAETRIVSWPHNTPKGDVIGDEERRNIIRLPCVGASFDPRTEEIYKTGAELIIESAEGLGIANMDTLIQGGNWIFPGEDSEFRERIGQGAFDTTFTKEKRGSLIVFNDTDGERASSWLEENNLPLASGKAALLLKRLNACRGVAFVYSRFVASGALTIALMLEANGYTAWGRDFGYLGDGNKHPLGRQCALCPLHERGHGTVPEGSGVAAHNFKPARYVLLTGSDELSPNNAGAITAARGLNNKFGEDVKVVVGSQVAGEGLDLRHIREVFVYDSWYHLNKLEQVVGRGIRNCSHAALSKLKRNCTVTLLVNVYESDTDTETIDMYSYRQAMRKAIVVGNVTRTLKEYAMDCSLNKDAILVRGIDPIPMILDSQGKERENVNINDTPLTILCDWMEDCNYDCKAGDGSVMPETIPLEKQDITTYDEYTARFQMNKIRAYIEDLIIRGQPFVTFDKLQLQFETIPRNLLASIMNEMVQGREMKVSSELGSGRIIYRHGYYIFQPDAIQDTSVPISIRLAHVPIPRDPFPPKEIVIEKVVEEGVDQEDSEELWEYAKEWKNELRDGTAGDELPDDLVAQVNRLRETAGVIVSQKERLSMILWMYGFIKDDLAVRTLFADIALQYIWDEFITSTTKRDLLGIASVDAEVRAVAADCFWEFEGQTYIRHVNSYTNDIEFICVDAGGRASPCPAAVVEVLKREKEHDPLLKRPIDVRYTGYEYGFVIYNPKKKKLVFKKNVPPAPRKPITRGSECAVSSATGNEIKLLKKLGETLRAAGKNDLGLREDMNRQPIANSVRVCTVIDLTLRMMDAMKIQGKRWFYRALEAKLHGHPLR